MAEKKSGGGFGTFLLIFLVVVLAVFFCIAGFLIVSPKSSVFGLQYRANIAEKIIPKVNGHDIFFKNYSNIVIDIAGGNGHTSVNVNYGNPEDTVVSRIVFNQNSSGYQRVGAQEEYTFNVTESGGTLNISITEPQYNFIQLANKSVLNINIDKKNDAVTSANITIKTGSGSVKVGGQINTAPIAEDMQINSLDAQTTSGQIQLTDKVKVNDTVLLKSKTGGINVSGHKSLAKLNLETETGKITTAEITTTDDISINSYNSIVTMGNIKCNQVNVDMESGILNFKNIDGKLISQNKILYTTVNADTITGETTLVNDQGNFAVNIKKIQGPTLIKTGNKSVSIGEVAGSCDITTNNGSISVKKLAGNNNTMSLETAGWGNISVTFEDVCGVNEMTTNSGRINMKFGESSVYTLTASSEKSKVYLTWLDISEKTFIEKQVPSESLPNGNSVTLVSQSGSIRVEKI